MSITTSSLEQLRYTWARRGPEGRNRFQIYGISEGLASPDMSGLRQVISTELLDYKPSRPRDAPLIAYGWLTRVGHLIAFCRTDLAGPQPRVGNFAVHVIVASVDSVHPAAIARRFASPFWWTGIGPGDDEYRAPDHRLPRVELSRVPIVDDAVVPDEALVHALATRSAGDRIVVVSDPNVFGRQLRAIASILPELLDAESLCTYERSARQFRIVGVASPPAEQPGTRVAVLGGDFAADATDREIVSRLLADPASPANLNEAWRELSGLQADLAQAWASTRALVSVSLGGSIDRASLRSVVSSRAAVALVVSDDRGRAAVADALIASDEVVTASIRQYGRELDEADACALARTVASRHLRRDGLRESASMADLLATCSRSVRATFLDALLDAVRAEPRLAASASTADADSLVTRAAERRLGVKTAEPLLVQLESSVRRCSDDDRFPDAYISVLLRRTLAVGRIDALDVIWVLQQRPRLLDGAELGRTEQDALLAALRTQSVHGLSVALPTALAALCRAGRVDEVERLLARLAVRDATASLIDALEATRDDLSEGLSRLVVDQAAKELAHLLSRSVASLVCENQAAWRLLMESGTADGERAARALDALTRPRWWSRTRGSRVLAEAAPAWEIDQPQLRSVVTEASLAVAVTHLRSREDTAELVSVLAELLAGTGADPVPILMSAATRNDTGLGNFEVLSWFAAEMLAGTDEQLTPRGRLRDERLQSDCVRIAVAAADRLGRVTDVVPDPSRRLRRWWEDLDRAAKTARAS